MYQNTLHILQICIDPWWGGVASTTKA